MENSNAKFVVPLTLAAAFLMFGCVLETVDKNGNVINPSDNTITPTVSNIDAGLKIEDTVVGTGAEAKIGDKVSVNYTGTLVNGTEFDSSIGKQPFEFTIGENSVIQGWEQGIPGMKVGGSRILTIPSSLGYGENAVGSIPANSTLIFKVDLLAIVK